MSDYPTEEEEYELMYQDELELLNEEPDFYGPSTSAVTPKEITKQPVRRNLNFSTSSNLDNTPNVSHISNSQGTTAQGQNNRAFSTPIAGPSFSNNLNDILFEVNHDGISRKRRLQDLFGDINDIDIEENEAKKSKTGEDADLALIKQILEARRLNKDKLNPLRKQTGGFKLRDDVGVYRPTNISYDVPKWPFITVTHGDSSRLYVRFHSTDYQKRELDEINFGNSQHRPDGLLGANKRDIWREAKLLLEKKELNQDMEFQRIPLDHTLIELAEDKLWVDLYRPKRYIELLSDEGTNRALLKWLKMWDKVVFHKEPIKPKFINPNEVSNFNKRTGKFDNTKWKTKKKNMGPVLNTERDEMGRPMQKIALLCGPPGLGKTTLAHTIARHAGYNILELNASDDRSPEMFRNILENGTQMRTLNAVRQQDQGKPNCIIIDEIDGAPVQSIEFLIKFASGSVTARSKKGNKSNQKTMVLRRPVICICNDIYVPALRSLRQSAFVVTFPPTEAARLAERLLEISSAQKLKTDLGALLALADKTNCDVRSCLSALQFFSGRQKQLRVMDIYRSNIGQKDMQKGMFAVWKDIFQIRRPSRGLDNSTTNASEHDNDHENSYNASKAVDMTLGTRMKYVLDTIYSAGDYDRLIQGVYENYLSMRQPDPDMIGICQALQWFCFSDTLLQTINSTQNYSIYAYVPYAFVVWHYQFASLAWQRLTFPTKGFEAQQRRITALGVLEALRNGAQTAGRAVLNSRKQLVLDTLGLVRRILSPKLRSVSLQLLTPSERCDLRHAVNVMADLGLAYSQGRSVDGTYHYQLEPDIDLVGLFPDIPQPPVLSYWTQQLIAREVDVEKIRRSAPKVTENDGSKPKNAGSNGSSKNPLSAEAKTSLPNHLQTLQPKAVSNAGGMRKSMVTKDFFGRISAKSSASTNSTDGFPVDAIVKSPIWYKYKEGCNQAVRRKVKMTDLI